MRIAIIASPRTGQTWLRSILWNAWGFPPVAVHNWTEAPAELPSDCLFGIHWPREPNFLRWLAERDFHVIVLARHPLDILVSALHFVHHEPQTARWLEGLTGLPAGLIGESPASPGFLRYALSFGSETLLSVSYQWWQHEGSIRIRYEDLVRTPEQTLMSIADTLGLDTVGFAPALRANSLEKLRAVNFHGWQGTPGLWRQLIPWPTARRIRARHRSVFEGLGYRTMPSLLTYAAAQRHWDQLRFPASHIERPDQESVGAVPGEDSQSVETA